MLIKIDAQLNFCCEGCGSPMDNNIIYDSLRATVRIEPCQYCLDGAWEKGWEEALKNEE